MDYTDYLITIIDGIDKIQNGIWTLVIVIVLIAVSWFMFWLSNSFTDI